MQESTLKIIQPGWHSSIISLKLDIKGVPLELKTPASTETNVNPFETSLKTESFTLTQILTRRILTLTPSLHPYSIPYRLYPYPDLDSKTNLYLNCEKYLRSQDCVETPTTRSASNII